MTQELPATFQTVTPGSADDPFTASPGNGTAAAATAPGAAPASPTAAVAAPPAPPAPPVLTTTPATPGAAPAPAVLTVEEFEKRMAGVQSAYDRRDNARQALLEQANERAERAEADAISRERAAMIARLDPAQLEAQKVIWEGEDRMRALDKKETAVVDLYRATEGQRLLLAYGDNGITEDDLLAYTGHPNGMEDYIKGVAFDRIRAGGASGAQAAAAVNAAAAAAPAGASGPTDIGNAPGGYNPPSADKGFGLNSMAANVKALFSEGPSLPF